MAVENGTRCAEVLLVEDNPGDVQLTIEAFAECGADCHLTVRNDGRSALGYLEGLLETKAERLPDLILLDLNMPGMDGRDLLERVKRHPKLRAIPAVVLTTSRTSQDVARAYELHANCYLVKPITYANFAELVGALDRFWFSSVTLPTNG